MIVRPLPDDRLLCINQTSHALMAEEFCRAWGNDDFARPQPYTAVMAGIAQHDNGWFEWEQRPRLRADGYPMDFMHGPTGAEKIAQWQTGVDRAAAQHPYAGLLVARHAVRLYQRYVEQLPADEQADVAAFVARQAELTAQVRRLWGEDAVFGPALQESRLAANTHLLKFGDSASLATLTPWGSPTVLAHCPLDGEDAYVDIVMSVGEDVITFDPWPFGVEAFTVAIHGRVLPQTHFADDAAYRRALSAAPLLRLTWQVRRAAA